MVIMSISSIMPNAKGVQEGQRNRKIFVSYWQDGEDALCQFHHTDHTCVISS